MAGRINGAQSLLLRSRSLSSSSFSSSSSSSSSTVSALVLLLALSHFLMTSAGDVSIFHSAQPTDPNPCASFPCGPVGSCIPLKGEKNGFTCECDFGFQQEDKEGPCVTIDLCGFYPCGPVGSCVPDKGGINYTCLCDDGFHQLDKTGPCEDIDECAGSDNPCAPGNCSNTLGDYMCECPSGYVEGVGHGERACIRDVHACKGEPCGPAGRCVPAAEGGYSCDCVPGFAPAKGTAGPCLEIEDPCIGNPCGSGGTCERVLGGGYRCCCSPGYTLPEMFKHFGGKCVKVKN
ncbi:hypothetical protein CBR_g3714 [Chara braunii]|uniref:EGF-like domain-containing protein n=1 Tax=Chara braunii TaxID=69332 RepID=A0A388KG23_CHABU|nr:hypothetical protein CBR_g3714 [Chara braunii]|eukprot:GBG69014.1 hypothetical protein CBR_g3714 [Chara braunii]